MGTSAKLVFVRRSEEETAIFGGTVYADLDGKNVAQVGAETITLETTPGTHRIKMYKSHEMGAMIGFAEVEITLREGEALAFKYTAPMLVSQPGHIAVSDFISYAKLEEDVQAASRQLAQDKQASDTKKRQAEEASRKNSTWIILLIIVIPAMIWLIYELIFLSLL